MMMFILKKLISRFFFPLSLVIDVHPTLTDSDMVDTCKAVEKVMVMAAR